MREVDSHLKTVIGFSSQCCVFVCSFFFVLCVCVCVALVFVFVATSFLQEGL